MCEPDYSKWPHLTGTVLNLTLIILGFPENAKIGIFALYIYMGMNVGKL